MENYNFQHSDFDLDYIGHSKYENLDCFFSLYYYPVNKYGYGHNQNLTFDFKNGEFCEDNSKILSYYLLKLFGKSLKKDEDLEFLKTVTILPVPASNSERNTKRFKKLFELISEKIGVQNGFECVKVTENIEQKHLQDSNHRVDKENFKVCFDKIKKPYRIVLIDDVITKGHAMRNLKRQLEKEIRKDEKDDSFIIGLTLSKTYSYFLEIDNNEDFHNFNDFDICDFVENMDKILKR